MKDKTIAVGLFLALAFVIAGMVIMWSTDYLGDTERAVNLERVRIQEY